jgi:hypothetical protein
MSRLATPPRFALPSVEAGQNDRELIYTTDSACVIRSPFMPQLADFNALSDASPAPALSPMNPTATLPGGNTAVDPKVLSGAWHCSDPLALSPVHCAFCTVLATQTPVASRVALQAFVRLLGSSCPTVGRARPRAKLPFFTRR